MKGQEHLASMLLTEIHQLCSWQHWYWQTLFRTESYLVFFTETDQKFSRTEKIKPSKEDMAEEMSNAKQFHMEPEKERLTHSVRQRSGKKT